MKDYKSRTLWIIYFIGFSLPLPPPMPVLVKAMEIVKIQCWETFVILPVIKVISIPFIKMLKITEFCFVF